MGRSLALPRLGSRVRIPSPAPNYRHQIRRLGATAIYLRSASPFCDRARTTRIRPAAPPPPKPPRPAAGARMRLGRIGSRWDPRGKSDRLLSAMARCRALLPAVWRVALLAGAASAATPSAKTETPKSVYFSPSSCRDAFTSNRASRQPPCPRIAACRLSCSRYRASQFRLSPFRRKSP